MRFFNWLRGRQPRPIADDLWARILAALPFLACLSEDEQDKLQALVERFLDEKEFSTSGGLQLSDEICLSIAAQGCLPILQLGLSAYQEWVGIIVYPDQFVVPRQIEDADGVIHEYADTISGEAWADGPLIISWRDAQMAGNGYNVVIHEFAHKLDMLNGEADGIPALHGDLKATVWREVFFAAYDDFCQRVDKAEETCLDPYASEDPAEFFAVMSECFFELPAQLNREYPDLYRLLCRYYRQDPLSRRTKPTSAASTAGS